MSIISDTILVVPGYVGCDFASKPERIRELIDRKLGKITKKEIMEQCPDISKVTVERTLTELEKEGFLEKVGAGRTTGYVRKN